MLCHTDTHQHTACQIVEGMQLEMAVEHVRQQKLEHNPACSEVKALTRLRCAWQVAYPVLLTCFACCPVPVSRKEREGRPLARHTFASHAGYHPK